MKSSRIASTSSIVRMKPGRADAKQSGQFILQLLLTSMMPRQACCWWSGQRPQSSGQPSLISVPKASGIVPGLLYLLKLMYISASPYTRASNGPGSGDRAVDGGEQSDIQAKGGEAVKREELFGEDVGLTPDDAIGL